MRFILKMRSPCLFTFCLNWQKKIAEVYSLLLVCHIVWRKYRDRLNLHSSCHRSELGFPFFYQAVEDFKKCRQSSVSPSLQFSNSGEAWASKSLMAPSPMVRGVQRKRIRSLWLQVTIYDYKSLHLWSYLYKKCHFRRKVTTT